VLLLLIVIGTDQKMITSSNSSSEFRQSLIDRFLEVRPAISHCFNSAKSPELTASLAKVTVHQLEALHYISRGKLTMSELAKHMSISESAATALIDRLFAQGLVSRFSDPKDRRMVKVGLSSYAERMIVQIEENRRRTVELLLSALEDEQLVTLVELLETIVTHLTTASTSNPPKP